jgi:hypothetical protein
LPRRSASAEESMDVKAQRFHENLRNQLHGALQDGETRTTKYLDEHALRTWDVLEEYVLGVVPQGDKYAGWLSIPYLTRAGIKAIKYRCMRDHDCKEIEEHSKYILTGDVRIFNPSAFADAKNVIGIAEGEIDAIVATTHLVPTVGFPGTEMWTQNKAVWKFALRDYDEILIFADGDKAGKEYARLLQQDLGATRAYLVACDDTLDVASMVAMGKADVLRERAGL